MTTEANAACPHCQAPNPAGSPFCESCGKALAAAPGADPKSAAPRNIGMQAAGRGWDEAELRKQLKKASGALLAVAILQVIFGPVALMLAKDRMERQAGPGAVFEIQPIAYVIVFGVAVAFFALWWWSRANPFGAAIVGLVLFVSVHLLDAVADPAAFFQGIIVKIIVIAVLVKAIQAGARYRKMSLQQPGSAPATEEVERSG